MRFKWVYLFLGLLFPLLISLFLRYFGKNEFNIPVYFKNGVDSIKTDCSLVYTKPYLVPDSIFSNFRNQQHLPMLITLDSGGEAKKNFQRLAKELGTSDYNLVSLKRDSVSHQLTSCILFLYKPWSTVLIDGENKIRGYYAPETLEEGDRLIVEMKILLKRY
jgi:protein SCO1/2